MSILSKFLLLLVLCVPLANSAAEQVCVEKVCYPKVYSVGGTNYTLRNVADHDYLLFDLYVTGIYTSSPIRPAIFRQKFVLSFGYQREISKQQLEDAALKTLRTNPQFDQVKYGSFLKQIAASFSDRKDGDRYNISYDPETGMKLFENGRVLLEITDPSFSEVYLGIWLSDNSFSSKLTRSLLKS